MNARGRDDRPVGGVAKSTAERGDFIGDIDRNGQYVAERRITECVNDSICVASDPSASIGMKNRNFD